LNDLHDRGSICRWPESRLWREEVEEGSKPEREGVRRAFRYWVIESSIVDRDMRRKSVQNSSRQSEQNREVNLVIRFQVPLSAVAEKQNWGVSDG
jgi:hypothetical protein